MRMSINTQLSGRARVDSTNVLPKGGVRGQTNFVNITEDVTKYAAEQGLSESQALESAMHLHSRARRMS